MEDDKERSQQAIPDDETNLKPDEKAPTDKKLSRIERIRKKIKAAQGKNPDIYPMW
jgi:hypothetical protein